LAPRDEPLQ
jgi:hypothetical protein